MSDQSGNREQPSDPPRTEYGYLAAGVAALTTSLLLCAGSYAGYVTVGTGVSGILAAMTVVGGVGWIVRSGDTKRRRNLANAGEHLRAGQVEVSTQLAELTSRVTALAEQASKAHTIHIPAQRPGGHMYLSQAATSTGDTLVLPKVDRPAVDGDALREEVERVVVEELGTREALQAQRYAEGYVDGVARREGEPPVV